jgi:cysteine desulfurase
MTAGRRIGPEGTMSITPPAGGGESAPHGLIYLDHNSTTPMAAEVLEAVVRTMRERWANAASAHAAGRAAREAIDAARAEVAALIDCRPEEILFTGGGTESNNLAVLGAARAAAPRGKEIVISAIEHAAVEEACQVLESEGFVVTRVPVEPDGRVRAARFIEAFTPETILASLMLANNETGALQPVAEVAREAGRRGILLHTDAAQAVGRMPVRVTGLGVDLLTIAGHKMHGPKGVGALYVKRGTPLSPVLRGAPHERGLRPGTENTPGIVGLGAAAALAAREMEHRVDFVRTLSVALLAALRREAGEVLLNGPQDPLLRLPNTLNVSLPGAPGFRMAAVVDGVAFSAGAACHSGSPLPSRVLTAMGVPAERAVCAIRLSLGRDNTGSEVAEAAVRIASGAARLRAESSGS